jgi:hypothetical protein
MGLTCQTAKLPLSVSGCEPVTGIHFGSGNGISHSLSPSLCLLHAEDAERTICIEKKERPSRFCAQSQD